MRSVQEAGVAEHASDIGGGYMELNRGAVMVHKEILMHLA